MAKSILGIDIGHRFVKLALVDGSVIKKTVVIDTPENLIRGNEVTSFETLAGLIKDAMKAHGLLTRHAGVVLNNEQAYVKTVIMPHMTVDQLKVNLPYEFKDYITGELSDYAYDYAMIDKDVMSDEHEEGTETKAMELMAVAAPKEYLNEIRGMLKKASLVFDMAAPAVSAYIGIIRANGLDKENAECCFLDLGHENIRMHMFCGDRYIVTRVLETGVSMVEARLADELNVDVHLAHTYYVTNHEDCQNSEVCRRSYTAICEELQRAIHFYSFSNPDSNLETIWLCGGGAAVPALCQEISTTLNLTVRSGAELVKCSDEHSFMLVPAIGITQQA